MGEKFKEILEEAAKEAKNKPKQEKMLKKLHVLDDAIEDFIDELEEAIIAVEEESPVFVKKCQQLLADMSKEYSEFMVALRSIVNAVDRKDKVVPSFEKTESRVRDVLDGAGNSGPAGGEEPSGNGDEEPPDDGANDDEYELKVARKGGSKNKKIKEALEI